MLGLVARGAVDALKSRDDLGVELPSGGRLDLGERLAGRQRRPVRALPLHRHVGGGCVKQTRRARDLLAGQARGVPAAVEVLVVVGEGLGDALARPQAARDLGAGDADVRARAPTRVA